MQSSTWLWGTIGNLIGNLLGGWMIEYWPGFSYQGMMLFRAIMVAAELFIVMFLADPKLPKEERNGKGLHEQLSVVRTTACLQCCSMPNRSVTRASGRFLVQCSLKAAWRASRIANSSITPSCCCCRSGSRCTRIVCGDRWSLSASSRWRQAMAMLSHLSC